MDVTVFALVRATHFLAVLIPPGVLAFERLVSRQAMELMIKPGLQPTGSVMDDHLNTLGGGLGRAVEGQILPEGALTMGGAWGPGAYIVPGQKLIVVYLTQLLGSPSETVVRPVVPALIRSELLAA